MLKTLKFTLDVTVEIDGNNVPEQRISEVLRSQLDEHFPPSMLIDDDELDCQVSVESWRYAPAAQPEPLTRKRNAARRIDSRPADQPKGE